MHNPSRWERLSSDFLTYWRHRATEVYLEAVTDTHRTKQDARTAGNLACIEIQGRTLRCIGRELRRRQG